jgi:hypothetical protein
MARHVALSFLTKAVFVCGTLAAAQPALSPASIQLYSSRNKMSKVGLIVRPVPCNRRTSRECNDRTSNSTIVALPEGDGALCTPVCLLSWPYSEHVEVIAW